MSDYANAAFIAAVVVAMLAVLIGAIWLATSTFGVFGYVGFLMAGVFVIVFFSALGHIRKSPTQDQDNG